MLGTAPVIDRVHGEREVGLLNLDRVVPQIEVMAREQAHQLGTLPARLDAGLAQWRVVAAEPQPALVRTLRILYGRDADVTIEPVAVGRTAGTVELKLNIDNPTVSTASDDFVAAARGARGWDGQAWTGRVAVPMTTLDALIARHGEPAFIKIDVEGFEAEALAGLTHPPPALSFEFTTIQRAVAFAALERCVALGFERFDAALGESQTLVHGAWRPADEMRRWLADLPDDANSGDIYAVRP